MRSIVMLFGLLGLVLVFGCGDDATPTADSGTVDTSMSDGPAADSTSADTRTAATFSAGVQPIFTASCAVAACHSGSAPQSGMNLSSGSAYSQLVGVASVECSTLERVEPGSPDLSYLVQKIEGAGSCFTGQRMPVGGSLDAAEIATIKGWITAGAKDD
jgi:hypothetical protein